MLDALSILNDPDYTPLVVGTGDPLATEPGDLGVFIIVATAHRTRSRRTGRNWLLLPKKLVRGGGRP